MLGSFGRFIPDRIKVLAQRHQIYNRYTAGRLARRARRLDLCAAQFAHLLHCVPHLGLENARCLEIGSGWVLTHTLVCYLLGAQGVTATDILPLAQPTFLREAVRGSDASLVREVLSPFSEYEDIRERLSRLQQMDRFTFGTLRELGIRYVAPFDLATAPPPGNYDFIYSFDVLEHVPRDKMVAVLTNLGRSLDQGGCMVHAIHTEDHRDSKEDPFAFLSEPVESYSPVSQMMRGNRLRRNEWRSVLDLVPGITFTFLYEWYRRDKAIPERIDPSIRATDDRDLRTAYLGVMGTKQ
jgi:cyclopropane fatty-acyl-phospholipid synthase-like methyltransferase